MTPPPGATRPRPTGTVLDHVAHAVHRWEDVWHRYATDLGADWASGGPGPGFAPGQVRFGNGSRIEMLQPHDTHVNDFLSRFLATSGPGPHHLTFKVPDLDAALDAVRSVGLEPIGVDRSDPEWQEAFLHPKVACGVVVQLAQAGSPWSSPPPDGYPTDRRPRADGSGPVPPADLLRVCHVVPELGPARALFGDLLGGRVVDEGGDRGSRWVDLVWSGPLGLRLTSPEDPGAPGPLTEWLGGRLGRVHHADFAVAEAESVPAAQSDASPIALIGRRAGTGGLREIPAEANWGFGLVLLAD